MMRRLTLMLVAVLQLSTAARADDEGSLARARKLFDQGETEYRLGNFDKALGHYQAALKLAHRPGIILNIAQCYRFLDKPDKALFFYELYLSDWERANPGKPSPYLDDVKQQITRLKATIREREQQRKLEQLRKEARARQRPSSAKASVTRPRMARIRVEGLKVARAQVLVDDEPRAVAPVTHPIEVQPGKRAVRVEAEGYLTWSQTIELQPGWDKTVVVSLRPVPGRSTFWLASTLTSVALAGGGEAMAFVYMQKANEHYNDTPAFRADRKMEILGHVLAGAFGALAATSLVLYLRSGKVDSPATSAATVVPLPGGVAAVGRLCF